MVAKYGMGFYDDKYKCSVKKIDIARKPDDIATFENGEQFEYDSIFYNVIKSKLLVL